MNERTHASFFSGVGGLDMGLERAGWRTVSFSEIDPYASAVLAQRWPGVPNLGDIVSIAARQGGRESAGVEPDGVELARLGGRVEPWHGADLWTGGFPCQDLSIAGKRRGMGTGTRSGLAYAFLGLVGRHRPRFVLLENVPGLLSSHGGRDMAALIGALVELGYGVGYRVLDARYFGVPQRRRRVFILGDSLGGRAGAERASEVLSVGSRCRRHPPAGVEAGPGVAGGIGGSPLWSSEFVGPIDGAMGHHGVATPQQSFNMGHIRLETRPPDDARGQGRRRQGAADLGGHEPDDGHVPDADAVRRPLGPSPDTGGVREADGLAGRSHDRGRLAATLNSGGNNGGFRTEPGEHLTFGASGVNDDPLLPLGLDSHRYRCCGNGVVSDVSEFLGTRLMAALDAELVNAA